MIKSQTIGRFVAALLLAVVFAACAPPTDVRIPKEIEEENPDPDSGDKGAFLVTVETVRLA